MERATILALIAFGLLMAAGAIWAGGRQSWAMLGQVRPSLLPALLAFSLVNYTLRGARWLLFSRTLRLGIPPARNALYYVAGFAMTATPGKLGEALRLWLLNRHHGAPYERTAGLLVADRLGDGVSTCLVVAATVGWFSGYRFAVWGALAGISGITLALLRPMVLRWALHLTYRVTRAAPRLFPARVFAPRLFVRGRRAIRALRHLGNPATLALAVLLGMGGWLAEGSSFALLLHSLGVTLAPQAAIFIFCFGVLVGAISFLPGGLGSTEATMIGLLASQGVPLGTAVVATGVVRVTTLWFAILLGICALPFALRARDNPRRA